VHVVLHDVALAHVYPLAQAAPAGVMHMSALPPLPQVPAGVNVEPLHTGVPQAPVTRAQAPLAPHNPVLPPHDVDVGLQPVAGPGVAPTARAVHVPTLPDRLQALQGPQPLVPSAVAPLQQTPSVQRRPVPQSPVAVQVAPAARPVHWPVPVLHFLPLAQSPSPAHMVLQAVPAALHMKSPVQSVCVPARHMLAPSQCPMAISLLPALGQLTLPQVCEVLACWHTPPAAQSPVFPQTLAVAAQ